MEEPRLAPRSPVPWWVREILFVLRMVAICIPIATFMGVLWGHGWKDCLLIYETTLLFGFVTGLLVRANKARVVPRLPRIGEKNGPAELALQVASFAAASLLGAFVSAAIASATFLKGSFSNIRAIIILASFAILFTTVALSDGVTEAASTSGEMYGEDRLLATVGPLARRPAAEIVTKLLDDVRAFSDGASQADDITVLVVRYVGSALPAPGRGRVGQAKL